MINTISFTDTFILALRAVSEENLLKFGTDEWYELPEVKQLQEDADSGKFFAQYIIAVAAAAAGDGTLIQKFNADKNLQQAVADADNSLGYKGAFLKLCAALEERTWDGANDFSPFPPKRSIFYKAAEYGDPIAQYNAGSFCRKQNTAESISEAVEWWKKSADQGNTDAMTELGILFHHGAHGIEPDIKQAVFYYVKSVEQGNIPAKYFLGKICAEGSTGIVNKDLAIKYLSSVAEQHPEVVSTVRKLRQYNENRKEVVK